MSLRIGSGDRAIRLIGVGVEYALAGQPSVTALSDIDLTIDVGERVALLGASGAGKSTLLDVIAGTLAPTRGDVEVLGADIGTLDERALRRHRTRVGVVRQPHGLPGQLRVIHNVNGGRLGTWSTWSALTSLIRPRCRPEAEAVLGRVGLHGVIDRRTSALSGGQQQRVAVARVLIQAPDLLLADEPVSAVDPTLSDDVLAVLSDDAAVPTGPVRRTLVVSLHDPALARRHVDRIVGIRLGRISFDLPAAEVTDAVLDDLYRTVG